MASWASHTDRELRQYAWEISEELVERELRRLLEPLREYRERLALNPADIVGRYEIARPTMKHVGECFSVHVDRLAEEGEAA